MCQRHVADPAWESLIQPNPSFQPGATIDDLVAEGVLALAFARPAGLQMGRTVTLRLTTPAVRGG